MVTLIPPPALLEYCDKAILIQRERVPILFRSFVTRIRRRPYILKSAGSSLGIKPSPQEILDKK